MEEIDLTDPTARIEHAHAERDLSPLSDAGEIAAWAMVEASPDGMLLADEHGTIAVVNTQVEDLFGFDRGELLGRAVEELLPERHRQVHTAHRTRYRARPNARPMGAGLSLLGRRKDGTEFPVEVSLSPLTTPGGLRVVATVRDITARVAADAHRHAVLHFIDAAYDGVFMFTPDTLEFQYVNKGAINQLGYSEAELLSMSPLHIKPEFTEASFRELLDPLLAGEVESHVFTTSHRRKDGRDVPVEIVLEYPPALAGPNPSRMLVALVRNITDRLEAEEAARAGVAAVELMEERERVARDLHDLVIQRLFAAGMSLQSVHGRITDRTAADRVLETVNELDDSISELRSAIFGLTSRPAKGVRPRLGHVVDAAAARLGFSPSVTIDADLDNVDDELADELVAILTEALSNVARHADASAVEVDVSIADNLLCLTVVDDGVGLDADAPRGSGLDNIERRAERVGGSATVEANPDGGTTLRWTAALNTKA